MIAWLPGRGMKVGDLALALPAIGALLRLGADVWLDCPPEIAATFSRLPVEHGKPDRWDKALVPRWVGRYHVLDAWRKAFDEAGIAEPLHRYVPPRVKCGVKLPPDTVLVAPYVEAEAKRWSADRWARVCEAAADLGWRVALCAPPEGAALCDSIREQCAARVTNLCGMDTRETFADLLRQADLVIAPDTGTVHVADAMGTPVVALYGATNPVRWAPTWCREYVVSAHPDGMGAVTVDAVIEALRRA